MPPLNSATPEILRAATAPVVAQAGIGRQARVYAWGGMTLFADCVLVFDHGHDDAGRRLET